MWLNPMTAWTSGGQTREDAGPRWHESHRTNTSESDVVGGRCRGQGFKATYTLPPQPAARRKPAPRFYLDTSECTGL